MTDLMKKLLDTKKNETLFLTPIKHMLMASNDFYDGREQLVIHPSELVDDEFCDLALYYRLIGWRIPPESNHFQLEVIFAQGHGYHDKYQDWAWKVGHRDPAPYGLRGMFLCLACLKRWRDTSPAVCPYCEANYTRLRYEEVPIRLESHNISGKSDGDIDLGPDVPIEKHPLLEIKSVGEGTIRHAAPKLLGKHTKTIQISGSEDTKKWTDWQAVWRDVKRPFKSHLKQGALYCLAEGRERMIYIYEFKPTGAVKEFMVDHDFAIIEDELETALDVMYAVEKRRPPDCPHGGCKLCEAYERLRDGDDDEEEDRPEGREDQDAGEGEGEAEVEGAAPTPAPQGRDPRGASRSRRPLRRGVDGGTSRAQRVGEPSRRRTRARGDHRGDRPHDLRTAQDDEDAQPRSSKQGRDDDRAKGTRRIVRRGSGI